jgi:hypothetical protein
MKQLIFVYNARSGLINSARDIGVKLLRPGDYSCNLCAITHNTFTEKKVWTRFRDESKVDMVFYHYDEFENEFPRQDFDYPVVLLKKGEQLTEVLSTEDLNVINDVEELIDKLVHNFQ